MTAREVLEALLGRGVAVWVDGDRLRCRAPLNALDDELRAMVEPVRAELVERLRGVRTCGYCRAPATLLLTVRDDIAGVDAQVCSGCYRDGRLPTFDVADAELGELLRGVRTCSVCRMPATLLLTVRDDVAGVDVELCSDCRLRWRPR